MVTMRNCKHVWKYSAGRQLTPSYLHGSDPHAQGLGSQRYFTNDLWLEVYLPAVLADFLQHTVRYIVLVKVYQRFDEVALTCQKKSHRSENMKIFFSFQSYFFVALSLIDFLVLSKCTALIKIDIKMYVCFCKQNLIKKKNFSSAVSIFANPYKKRVPFITNKHKTIIVCCVCRRCVQWSLKRSPASQFLCHYMYHQKNNYVPRWPNKTRHISN